MAAGNGHSSTGSSRFTWDALEWPTFLIFDEEWTDLGLGDDDLRELQSAILAAPERYPIIRRTGGLRKIRFAPSREARGKSGAYRVGYVGYREFGFILLVTAWGKSDKSDLSASDRNAVAAIVRDIRRALEARKDRWSRHRSSRRRVRRSSRPWSGSVTRSRPAPRSSSVTPSAG